MNRGLNGGPGQKQWDILAGFVISAVILVTGISCLSMLNDVQIYMNDNATSTLINTTRVIESTLNDEIQEDFDSLSLIGKLYQQGSLSHTQIQEICKSMGFEWVAWLDRNGEGEGFFRDSSSADILENFDMSKASVPGHSTPAIGSSGRLESVFWVPCYQEDTLSGLMLGSVALTKYYSNASFTFYGGAGKAYLIDASNGNWIVKSVGVDGASQRTEDIYSLLEDAGNDSQSIEAFRTAIQQGQAGTARFQFDNQPTYLCFMPLTDCPDWYLATVVTSDALLRESQHVQRMIIVVLAVFFVSILFFTIIFSVWRVRKTRQREADYREVFFSNVSSNIDSVFLIYEKDTKSIVFVSDNATRLLGVERSWLREDVGNLFFWCGIPETDPDRVRFLAGALSASISKEVCVGKPPRYLRLEMIPADAGQEIVVLTDITEEKAIQSSLTDAMHQAEVANQAKNEFLSSMSHDIRTPINGIMGMTAIASAHSEDPARVRDCLGKITQASSHLLSLVDEVLDMSRLENGATELSKVSFNIADALQEVLDISQSSVRKKNHSLRSHFHFLRHRQVIGDPLWVQRIAYNLLSNAVKYTPNGGKIYVSLREKSSAIPGYARYVLRVQDNGFGMSPEFQKKLFVPFEREQDARISRIQGTGLGMPIVKKAVGMMMGDIRVESEKDKGTSIIISLHLEMDVSAAPEEEPPAPALPEEPMKISPGKHILLAEDNPLNGEIAKELLSMLGVKSTLAKDGAAAVETFRSNPPGTFHLILMDIRMPIMDGYEATGKIRSMEDRPDGQGIPIIALTADALPADIQRADASGLNGHLAKPISIDTLRSTLIQYLGQEEHT